VRILNRRLPAINTWLLVLSVGLNVILAREVRKLRAGAQTGATLSRVGQLLPSLVGRDTEGRLVKVRFDDRSIPTLLYVMDPGCTWCRRNSGNMNSLINQANGRYRVVVISLSTLGLEQYRRAFGVSAPMLTVSDSAATDFGSAGTPRTLLVSPEGRVLDDWIGAFSASTARKIEETVGVQLPGLLDLDGGMQSQPSNREDRRR